MNVVLVASEMRPFSKTGGLADVEDDLALFHRHGARKIHDADELLVAEIADLVQEQRATFGGLDLALAGVAIGVLFAFVSTFTVLPTVALWFPDRYNGTPFTTSLPCSHRLLVL